MLHSNFDIYFIFLPFKIKNIFINCCFTFIYIANKFFYSTLIVEFFFLRIFFSCILKYNF